MEFVPPTYEEYMKANSYARFRYKWGLVVTALSLLAIIILIVFILLYSNELKTHPIRYMMDKFDFTDCTCETTTGEVYHINETTISWRQNPLFNGLG